MNKRSDGAQVTIPTPDRELRMPDGTPLGLGILGAARFSAIRRVLDHAARAASAKASFHYAEGEVATALIERERARNRLRNLDAICADDDANYDASVRILRLRQQLETMELEDKIAEREARRDKIRTATGAEKKTESGVASDDFATFISDMKRLPEIVSAVSASKEQIVKNAGGEEKLSESDRQALEILDAMLHAFMSNKAGETAL